MTEPGGYETVIGLEVHAQLLTDSKMFCGCSTDYLNSPPNTHVCPVCLGLPGAMPVANKHAIEHVMTTALALHCGLTRNTRFDRKNYFYPDLMKGYQISQYDAPIGHDGWLNIQVNGENRRIGITRVHLEDRVGTDRHAVALEVGSRRVLGEHSCYVTHTNLGAWGDLDTQFVSVE